jgi:hypothetical protein
MAEIAVPRRMFSIEDPWAIPAGCVATPFRRATDGSAPRLSTSVVMYRDDTHLHVLFTGEDDRVVATYLGHDEPLYEEDVVELFIAPHDTRAYFELEVNPLGTTFDARIESPDGVRATMRADLAWTCDDLFVAVLRETSGDASTFATLMRIPFASLGRTPAFGDQWRANLFRIDRHPNGDEYSAWQPTMKTPADFHVAAAFGVLRFE